MSFAHSRCHGGNAFDCGTNGSKPGLFVMNSETKVHVGVYDIC